MEIFKSLFLSHILTDTTPTYGNRDRFVNQQNSSFQKGDKAETSNWYFSNNHFGTHIDAPRHFIPGGKTITDYNAGFWVFKKVALIEVRIVDAILIDIDDVNPYFIAKDTELLLIKTGYEAWRADDKYWNVNPGLAPELGKHLRRSYPNLRAIGFDFISVTSFQHRPLGRDAHLALLEGENPILPIEDMSLKKIDATMKIVEVFVAPLRVAHANGTPVTVLAKIQE
jgi:arylformamidase